MTNKTDLSWDGEKIKMTTKVDETNKISTKELLNSIDQATGQLNQMEGQLQQMDSQKKNLQRNIVSVKEYLKERREFEEKAVSIQKDKLSKIIQEISEGHKEEALADAQETIDKDPDAYGENALTRIAYLNYQKRLATDKKVSEKIANRIIKEYLYETPIFENPFKP